MPLDEGGLQVDVLGIDIGGTGIKGAPVDVTTGTLTQDRFRLLTPQPATPAAVGATVADVVKHFDGVSGRVGSTFPAVIQHGVALTAANVDRSWIGADARALLEQTTDRPFTVLNDADAAGVAEMAFGAGKNRNGVVMMVTIGTGLGTALFIDGQLVPNTELGHIEIRGKDAELRASAGARKRRGLSMRTWAPLLDEYIDRVDRLLWPDLIILGGGVSRRADEFVPLLTSRPRVVAARLRNDAGIVGAAMRAAELAATPAPAAPPRVAAEDVSPG
jgi:polyphosphate glucokinase